MRFWIYLACCLLASGVLSKAIPSDSKYSEKANKRAGVGSTPELVAVASDDNSEEDDDDEPKRLVVYYNFEKVMKHGKVSDKSGYENSGTMAPGGEVLKFDDKDYTCNQAARLWDHDIYLRGDTFQAKPKQAITIAAWIKLEERAGQHSIFDTIGTAHTQGQFHFEVNDGVARWFHRDECQHVVFETMAHTVPKGKWTHLAGTYDYKTKQAKIFINGEIRNQSIGEGQLSRDWGIRAGIGNKEKHRALRGSIDEFRIYNYALKPDEIKALVSACKAGSGDENASTAAADVQAPQNDASSEAAGRSTTGTDEGAKSTPDANASSDTGQKVDDKKEAKSAESTESKAVLKKRSVTNYKRSCVRKQSS